LRCASASSVIAYQPHQHRSGGMLPFCNAWRHRRGPRGKPKDSNPTSLGTCVSGNQVTSSRMGGRAPRFNYATRIAFGLQIVGQNESTGNHEEATGLRASALKFGRHVRAWRAQPLGCGRGLCQHCYRGWPHRSCLQRWFGFFRSATKIGPFLCNRTERGPRDQAAVESRSR
jgi:hypothetical protein